MMRLWTVLFALQASLCGAQEAPSVVANEAGSFAGGAVLSLEADADEIAALEQQAFREFRWEVVATSEIVLAFASSDASAAVSGILFSTDGETFQPLPENTLALEGQVLAVVVTQITEITDESASFLPSDWSFDIRARPIPPLEGDTIGPILLPITFGDELGCEERGCGEDFVADETLPEVAGEPRSEAGEAPLKEPAAPPPDRDLARTLQEELARVGCYTIAVDGLWGPGSRGAMEAFNAARGTAFSVEGASPDALVAVARETGPVCNE